MCDLLASLTVSVCSKYLDIMSHLIYFPLIRLLVGMKFYRVQVGIQSPQGISAVRGTLRRFSDFLKLFAAVSVSYVPKLLY